MLFEGGQNDSLFIIRDIHFFRVISSTQIFITLKEALAKGMKGGQGLDKQKWQKQAIKAVEDEWIPYPFYDHEVVSLSHRNTMLIGG